LDFSDVERRPGGDTRYAPEGWLWVCHACGKTAKDRYGETEDAHPLWDESCLLNSGLYSRDRLVFEGDRVIKIKEYSDGDS